MSSSGDLERMKSLSSAGHHGGVRVFHDTVEIARLSTAVFWGFWVVQRDGEVWWKKGRLV